jgi:hypothetical protein
MPEMTYEFETVRIQRIHRYGAELPKQELQNILFSSTQCSASCCLLLNFLLNALRLTATG